MMLQDPLLVAKATMAPLGRLHTPIDLLSIPTTPGLPVLYASTGVPMVVPIPWMHVGLVSLDPEASVVLPKRRAMEFEE